MNESTTNHFTGCASLAAVGVKLRQLDVFGPICKSVHIAQNRTVSNVREMKVLRNVLRERGPRPATPHLGLRP